MNDTQLFPHSTYPLSNKPSSLRLQWILVIISFFMVAFGQPAWSEWLALAAASVGYALFWGALLSFPTAKKRFLIGTGWFACVQFVQFSWVLSHPYYYIYPVLLLFSLAFGMQWGVLTIGITRKSIEKLPYLFALAGLWTLFEWFRLLIFSGMPFNPVGLALSGNGYTLQMGALIGIYGLSFFVIITNLLFLRSWIFSTFRQWSLFLVFLLFPYFFGWEHLSYHEPKVEQAGTLNAVLVQTAFPVDEQMGFQSAEEARQFAFNKWRQILLILKKQIGQKIDLIVFPEYVVLYGTYPLIYPELEVKQLFEEVFGPIPHAYPSRETYFGDVIWTDQGDRYIVSNAYIVQTLANLFHTHLMIGLEDSEYAETAQGVKKGSSFSAAFHFKPGNEFPLRYEKRVLVPMGEYIPFEWCRQLAAEYGISGSFACGKEAKVFSGPVPFGFSICYEELFSDLIRENRMKGAELLVNLTNDGWFPHSLLPKQHFDHARLRTVENGIPLIRACNTGVTGAIDSLGRIVGVLGDNHMKMQEVADSILLKVPRYHYTTLYSLVGDKLILILSAFCLIFGLVALYYFQVKK